VPVRLHIPFFASFERNLSEENKAFKSLSVFQSETVKTVFSTTVFAFSRLPLNLHIPEVPSANGTSGIFKFCPLKCEKWVYFFKKNYSFCPTVTDWHAPIDSKTFAFDNFFFFFCSFGGNEYSFSPRVSGRSCLLELFAKFIEVSMETPCWCTFVVHQYGGRILKKGTIYLKTCFLFIKIWLTDPI